jgi:phosphatidylserine/phosphatidylglycerophosphate/cardiolipin synthase-like enzyme
MARNQGSSPASLPPTFSATDGKGLVSRLLSQLRSPYLTKVVAVSYRYNDFDLQSGRRASVNSPSGLVRLLEQQLALGVGVTVVTCDPFEDDMDPLRGNALRGWYQGLQRLRTAGATVKLHPKLHAKVYLFEAQGNRRFFAVGSSNLTSAGMGFRWSECNVSGYHDAEYIEIQHQVERIIAERDVELLDEWERRQLHSAKGLLLAGAL